MVPTFTGWNVAVAVPFASVPGAIVTVAGTVPTAALLLVRETVSEAGPASGCVWIKLPLVSSCAVEMLRGWLPDAQRCVEWNYAGLSPWPRDNDARWCQGFCSGTGCKASRGRADGRRTRRGQAIHEVRTA